MTAIVIAGATGGLGKLFFDKLDTSGTWEGTPIDRVIAIERFPGMRTPPPSSSSSSFFVDSAAFDGTSALKGRCVGIHWDATQMASTNEMVNLLDDALDASFQAGSTSQSSSVASKNKKNLQIRLVAIFTGMGHHGNLQGTNIEKSGQTLRRMLAINCEGPALLCQHLATRIAADAASSSASEDGGNGNNYHQQPPVMLVLSSYSGLIGLPHRAAYCSGKFALNGYLESLHAEFRDKVRLVLVCPTSVSTAFRSNWQKLEEKEKKDTRGGVAVAAAANKSMDIGDADMTPDECIQGIWDATVSAATNRRHSGCEYVIMPKKPLHWRDWKICNAVWGVRCKYFGFDEYVRSLVLRGASKKSKL